jgi:hypothetical protein
MKEGGSQKSISEQKSFMMEWSKRQAPLSRERVNEMNDALLRLIILDCQPFSIVTDRGFKSLVSSLEPRFKLPARTTLSGCRLHTLFAETLESAWKKEVNVERVFSVTVDGWKSRSNMHLIGITAHYINTDWQFMSLPLDLVPLAQADNVRIAETIRDCLERRHIPTENVVSLCTDGGGDMQYIGEH